MFKGFKQFILRGNVIDLAVGVVIGAAFGSLINSVVADVINPLIAVIVRVPNIAGLSFTLRGSRFLIGNLINSLISFVLIAAAVYFFVVVPINTLITRARRGHSEDPTTKKCPECTSEIPIYAKRCPHCTSVLLAS